jgi:hypothetical protein
VCRKCHWVGKCGFTIALLTEVAEVRIRTECVMCVHIRCDALQPTPLTVSDTVFLQTHLNDESTLHTHLRCEKVTHLLHIVDVCVLPAHLRCKADKFMDFQNQISYNEKIDIIHFGGCGGTVDATDLKSVDFCES